LCLKAEESYTMLNFIAEMQEQLILFISGGGSNARKIIHYFKENERVKVVGVLSSKPNLQMENFCDEQKISYLHIPGNNFESYLQFCSELSASWIILAGFLKKIPSTLLSAFPDRIINIHPALLPNYGGAGMYGQYVHQAVCAAEETFSGITIHLVNEEFDKGKLLFQHAIALKANSTALEIEQQVRTLELLHYAKDLDTFIRSTTR
jgi:phosphoribosylglycinamide formyltransferase 1